MKYVKRNFAKNRTFHNFEKLNEDCLAWLERTGNGKVHNTTKKIPAEVFVLEKTPYPGTSQNKYFNY